MKLKKLLPKIGSTNEQTRVAWLEKTIKKIPKRYTIGLRYKSLPSGIFIYREFAVFQSSDTNLKVNRHYLRINYTIGKFIIPLKI